MLELFCELLIELSTELSFELSSTGDEVEGTFGVPLLAAPEGVVMPLGIFCPNKSQAYSG